MVQVLGDVNVVDFTWHIAGPYATKLLADYGAVVLKVERPVSGDPARAYPPFLGDKPHPEKSGLFLHLNTNKKGITLDLKSEEGKKIALRLIEDAALVVESFSPGVMDRLGLGYAVLEKINPRLVMVSVSNFGQNGPYRDFKASELVLNAVSTAMKSCGNSRREPIKMGGNVVQYQAGAFAAIAAMTGLMTSRLQGIGQHIDVAINEALLTSMDRIAPLLLASQYTGENSVRVDRSSTQWSRCPDGIYPCKDGYWALEGGSQWWPNIFKMMGEPVELANPRYGSAEWQADPSRQAEILSVFLSWSMKHTKEELFEAAAKSREAAAPLYTVNDLLANRHLAERGYFIDIEHPVTSKLKYPGPPCWPEKTPWMVRRPAPLLGEHNEEVLGGMAHGRKDIDRIQTAGILSSKRTVLPKLPLEGIRVLDQTVVWAGPYASMILADMGAEVIRVESPNFAPIGTRGIVLRPPEMTLKSGGLLTAGYPNREAGARPWNRFPYFNVHARNKRSMTVKLNTPEGIDVFKRLARVSDVVIDNNAYGAQERLGLGYTVLSEVNPGIIYVSMPGYGNRGPWKDRIALGIHLEHMAGHTLLRKYPDLDASEMSGIFHCDATAGAMGAFAALLGLFHRNKTGEGQFIDVAQIETFIPQLGEAVMDYVMNGRIRESIGNHHEFSAPCNVYRCRGEDRWIAITVNNDEQWKALCRILGDPQWTKDEKFSTQEGRLQHWETIDEHVQQWTIDKEDYDVMFMLQQEGVPAGVVMDEQQHFTDPQLVDRQFFEQVPHEDCGTHLYPGMPFKMQRPPAHIRKPSCRFGEDNEYVYKQILEFSDEEYETMERNGHISMDYHPSISVRGVAKEDA